MAREILRFDECGRKRATGASNVFSMGLLRVFSEKKSPVWQTSNNVLSPNPLCLVVKFRSLQDHCAFQTIADMFNYNPNE